MGEEDRGMRWTEQEERVPEGCDHGRPDLEEAQVPGAAWIYALDLHISHLCLLSPPPLHFNSTVVPSLTK